VLPDAKKANIQLLRSDALAFPRLLREMGRLVEVENEPAEAAGGDQAGEVGASSASYLALTCSMIRNFLAIPAQLEIAEPHLSVLVGRLPRPPWIEAPGTPA
jgi:hypothetical protein